MYTPGIYQEYEKIWSYTLYISGIYQIIPVFQRKCLQVLWWLWFYHSPWSGRAITLILSLPAIRHRTLLLGVRWVYRARLELKIRAVESLFSVKWVQRTANGWSHCQNNLHNWWFSSCIIMQDWLSTWIIMLFDAQLRTYPLSQNALQSHWKLGVINKTYIRF